MIDTKILSEKLKYILITESKNDFDIMEVSLEIDETSNDGELLSYTVEVKFDYLGAIDPIVYYFVKDIERMSDKMRDMIGTYVLNPKGKFVVGDDNNASISDGYIWSSKFNADETHEFVMSFRITIISEE